MFNSAPRFKVLKLFKKQQYKTTKKKYTFLSDASYSNFSSKGFEEVKTKVSFAFLQSYTYGGALSSTK